MFHPNPTKIKEMNNIFSVFDDPMDKYTQIIELGKKNNGLDAIDKNDINRIYGCCTDDDSWCGC